MLCCKCSIRCELRCLLSIVYVFSKYYLDRLGVRSFVIAIDIWNEVCTAQARGSSDSTAQRSCVNGTDFPLECGAVTVQRIHHTVQRS